MKHDKNPGRKTKRIHWHLAFVEAIQLELKDYRGKLEFHHEYHLSAEPLKIDCVIIKKAKNLVITKNIAAIFRDVNLLEYKSPDAKVSVSDFYKVYGYACIYASFTKIPITNLTISFVVSHRPVKLLKHLEKIRNYSVEESGPGIYNVKGDVLPIQVIDSRQLPVKENLWLKCLRRRLDPREIIRLSDEIVRQDRTARIKAFIDVISRANFKVIAEAKKMNDAVKSLEEVFVKTGWAAIWEARGKDEQALTIAQNMVKAGFPLETIIAMTNLEARKVKGLYKATDLKPSRPKR